MRMIRAVIRPDREEQVVNALESTGIVSLTKMDVFGRGQQPSHGLRPVAFDGIAVIVQAIGVEDAQIAL